MAVLRVLKVRTTQVQSAMKPFEAEASSRGPRPPRVLKGLVSWVTSPGLSRCRARKASLAANRSLKLVGVPLSDVEVLRMICLFLSRLLGPV